jgi:hypothetical protein
MYVRTVGVLVAAGFWLAMNAVLWYCLLEVPPFKGLPPVPIGVAGILANFYLIPLARKLGVRTRQRIEQARTAAAPWP